MDDKYMAPIAKTIQNALRIKTVLDEPVQGGPFGKGNKECLEYVLSVAKELGFETKNLDGYCGYAQVGEGDEIVGIVGHLDVVPEGDGWIHPAYSGELVDGEIWGRGAIDDKGPSIISLFAIKALMDEGVKFSKRVRVIFGCNEETGSRCMEHYLKVEGPFSYGVSPDSEFPVIFAEKTINSVELKGKSQHGKGVRLTKLNGGIVINAVPDVCTFTLECDENADEIARKVCENLQRNSIEYDCKSDKNVVSFTAYGKAAHGSVPQCGVNAISYSLDALKDVVDCDFVRVYNTYISTFVHGEKLGCHCADEYGEIAVNVGLCSFENGEYSIKINSRLPFSTDTNAMFNGIKDALKCENGVEIVLMSQSEGFKIDPDSKMIKVLVDAYRKVTGDYQSKPICTPGGTYAREFPNCVAFGPEMHGYGEMIIHQPNERISLKAIEAIFDIYRTAYKDLVNEVSFKN